MQNSLPFAEGLMMWVGHSGESQVMFWKQKEVEHDLEEAEIFALLMLKYHHFAWNNHT